MHFIHYFQQWVNSLSFVFCQSVHPEKTVKRSVLFSLVLACVSFGAIQVNGQANQHGTLLTKTLHSVILRDNRVGLNAERTVKVYLPPGYEKSGKHYPVVYYLNNFYSNNEQVFADGRAVKLIERAFATGIIKDFIFVAADYSTALIGSLYENSPVSGRWLDFTTNEVVPFIDSQFRTISNRNSRAVIGDFFGGRGALKLAMTRPDIFSVVYALHPVATGQGNLPWVSLDGLDFKKMYAAKSPDDLRGSGRTLIFFAVCQGFLPNLSRPPLYCDFLFEPDKNGELELNSTNMQKAKTGFQLEETLVESSANLKTMRGLAFDWGRFDPNQDHVIANRNFSRRLEDLGVEHEAEEYRGDPFSRVWTDDGRFYTRVLPFLARYLVFDKN
ncbi:MAG TPA: alpha/beta hydrolase-fold protein [Puia sp.]|nr:alpha/beta hydrolase-fold protein [Puia sp.]